jgi:DNA-directed RNA polymerase II subunit RPB2
MDTKDKISWKIIDKYFNDNPNNLVAHHLESYNDFFNNGINRIFRENNPIRFIEREDESEASNKRNECLLYLGGKDGSKIYFGKPIIYDDNHAHYMYPNDARLRNMTYGTTIHYDVDVDFIYYKGNEKMEHSITLSKIYLGRFPIMLQSDLCILKSLNKDVRFNMGECKNDYGGYFIIDGKEKVVIPQEKFADNMLYIRKNKADDTYSHSAEIRSVSEDASKPIRTTAVKIVAPSPSLSNNQIVVAVPNVRKPVPLFILMRALGIISDKEIIKTCLLDLEKNKDYVDLFIPCVHDANKIFNQETALKYIASFTKRGTVSSVIEILSDYFLPHVGEVNFLDKAFFVGYMVYKLLKVYTLQEKPTDRDNFRFKRIELTGSLIYDLFREYFLIQKRSISKKIDEEYYYHKGEYKNNDELVEQTASAAASREANKYKDSDNFIGLIETNFKQFFKDREVELGFKKAFKGNWGSETHTKRLGVVQDLNRLSYYTFISHLRKINLPLDASAKVVGPRLLNSSQWGLIDPIDTPDGGNIGLHKHLAISTHITSGSSARPLIKWLRNNTPLKLTLECHTEYLSNSTKVLVNGNWIGVVDKPIMTSTDSKNDMGLVELLKLYRRNGIIPTFTSISFDYEHNEINIYTDSGRLTRPVYYIENNENSYDRKDVLEMIQEEKVSWEQIVSGFKKKDDESFNFKSNKVYELNALYSDLNGDFHNDIRGDIQGNTDIDNVNKIDAEVYNKLQKYKSVLDYLDTAEEESALIANQSDDNKKNKYYTHLEIDPSLILGVMGNLIIYPEHNPVTRNSFSCGQSKQAVSMYHTNYQMRIDKMGVILNYGQIPLVKSRYLEYINNEEIPYGVNAIVAIMCYTGYNVEDAILINEGAVQRGIFRTTYYSMYEAREESSKVSGMVNSRFANIEKNNVVKIKPGYDYSLLDDHGMIKENTPLNDKIVLIGKITSDMENKDRFVDDSVKPKKGQLGFVDKSFITQGEEGFNIAKVRIREERIPAIGDKMASRAGQKGTLGLIIPEEDMPFTADGIRPDIIINPHAIPSRMTIGQIVESLFGKVCTSYGAFGDCTAFQVKGSNYSTYAPFLVKAGFNSTGNQILYNGMTGEQIQSDIYIGPTYYMRLKHMVKDKINYRATGPRTNLTRQTVQGRANDGGLRIGEMERDGVLAHGMSYFLNESFMIRGDEYFMAICNKTGAIAIYNEVKNLFLSPFADGPVNFHTNPDGSMNVQNISKFGRSFSLVRIPYSFKLLIQELQTMNIQMRIITDENVDQMLSLSYSNNIDKLLNNSGANGVIVSQEEDYENSNNNLKMNIVKLKSQIKNTLTIPVKNDELSKMETTINEIDSEEQKEKEEKELPYIPIDIKPMDSTSEESVPYAPGSPAYKGSTNSDEYQPGSSSPYVPDIDSETSPVLIKRPQQESTTGFNNPRTPSDSPSTSVSMSVSPSLPMSAPMPAHAPEEKKTILEVEEKKEETPGEESSQGNNESNNDNTNTSSSSSSNETKKIII